MKMRYVSLLLVAGCSSAPASGTSSPPPVPASGLQIACTVEAEGGDPASAAAPGASLDVRRSGTKVAVLARGPLASARDVEAFLAASDDYLTRSRSGPRIYRLSLTGASLTAARAVQAFQSLGIRTVTATVSGAGGQTTVSRLESPEELLKVKGATTAYGAAPPTQLTYYAPRGAIPQLLLITRTDAAVLKLVR